MFYSNYGTCISNNEDAFNWNFVANYRLCLWHTDIGECDINSDGGRCVLYSATCRRRPTWQVRSTVNDDRRLLIALGVQLCVQHDGRLGVRQRRAVPSALVDIFVLIIVLKLHWFGLLKTCYTTAYCTKFTPHVVVSFCDKLYSNITATNRVNGVGT